MPRRRIERPTPEKGKIIDMTTGETITRPGLPVICGRVKSYREKAGLEQKALAKQLGVTPNAVSNWENGRGRPDIDLLPKLCEVLDITMNDLFGIDDSAGRYTVGEQALVEQYRDLTPGHRLAVEHLVDALLQVQAAESTPPIRKLMYFSRRLAAGTGDPTEFEEEASPIYLYSSRQVDRADCVFTVNGDSMEPVYHSGDMVLVSRIPDAPRLQPGEVGAFITGNETYIKVYQEDGLHSLNPNYAPMHFQNYERIYLIGRVTGTLTPDQIATEADISKYQMLHAGEA